MKSTTMSAFFFMTFGSMFAQTSLNTNLVGNLNFGRFHSDVWGYIDTDGTDYAIVGVFDGVSVVKVTESALEEVDFFRGAESIWRDIKTHGDYAYVTADQGQDGLTILDLSGLPNSVRLVGTNKSAFVRAHNLYIANGYAYISGSNVARGVDILDLSNPELPVKVGEWAERYFHDVIVRNDTLFGSAGGSSSVVVLDVRDKSAPEFVTEIPFPSNGYAHNAWITEDGKYLMTTEETQTVTVKMWNISDVFNPELVHQYLAKPNSIAHNAHILGDYAYISHYEDGLSIIDISDREHMVEVGFYDTFPDDSRDPFEGNWGAFPFTASGYIYATDEDYGLFVVEFNGRKASRLRGRVVDAETGDGARDVTLEVLESGLQVEPNSDGSYKLGFPNSGEYTIEASGFFYQTATVTLSVDEGQTSTQDIVVGKKQLGDLAGQIKDDDDNGIVDARIKLLNTPFDILRSNGNGVFSLNGIPEGRYSLIVGRWAFRTGYPSIQIVGNQVNSPELRLPTQYFDDFELDLGWEIGDDTGNFTGPWRRIAPEEIGFGLPFNPSVDITADAGRLAYFARSLGTELTLTSPSFDLTGLPDAALQYYQHWLPRGDNGDSLVVEISSDDGASWTLLAAFSDQDGTDAWTKMVLSIPSSVQRTAAMRIRFTSKEKGLGSSFAFLDEFEVLANLTSVPDSDETLPATFVLHQNYPNPFNASTAIRYALPEPSHVALKVYNLVGQRIRTLVDDAKAAGSHVIVWDSKDDTGRTVSSGVYFYRLQTDGFTQTNKMVLVP